ncbi:MAG: glucose-1-phosphate adenylyltransferase [Thermoanaerobaculales bacterium]|nr:glucose-1-phosphate adenylyltransferase [Thermoanaerobaculales bacterium]
MSMIEDLAREVSVLILGGGRGTRLAPLTTRRSKPAVPIGGKYRLIDIPISNAINSGMERMYVLTQFNSVSLHRHIGRTYRFDAFSRGYVHILAAQQTPAGETWFQGTADAVRHNLPIIRDIEAKHVLILAGDHMYRMDYRLLLGDHVENNADITIGVMPCSEGEIAEFGAARVDSSGRILEFREKPKTAEERAGMEVSPDLLRQKGVRSDQPYLASMGIYIFRKEALLEALSTGLVDFGGDIIPAEVSRRRIQAHFFKGYWRDIGTIRAFFDAHMDLVRIDPPYTFHDRKWPVYTRPRYLPGTRLHGCSFDQCLLADGSILKDSEVKNSVIGIRSVVRSAVLEKVLLMGVDSRVKDLGPDVPPVGVGEGTIIRNAIIDKNARIGRNVRIVNADGVKEAEGEGWCIRDGIVVVAKNIVIPDGSVI